MLFAFLLIVPFQARFPDLTTFQRSLYLVVLVLVALSTAFALGPVDFDDDTENQLQTP